MSSLLLPHPQGRRQRPPGHSTNYSSFGAVYRLWAGLRLKDLLLWQERWIHPGAAAFRPKFSTEQPATTVALAIEGAAVQGMPLLGVSLDYVKCFDSIPQGILYHIVETQGMDRGVLRALRGMYANTAVRFRVGLPASLGKSFHPTNGIFQGCPLSVILVNAMVSVWARIMDKLPGGLRLLPDSRTTVTLGMEESFQPIPPEQRGITSTGFADDTYQMESPHPAIRPSGAGGSMCTQCRSEAASITGLL